MGERGPNTVPGTVIAVFARSFYLANRASEIACIGPSGLGRGPLNMLCELPRDLDWRARGLLPGSAAHRNGAILYIDGIGAFSLADAVAWRPRSPRKRWNAATLAGGLAALAASAAAETREDGFVPLVASLARGRLDEAGARATDSPLLRLAAPAIASIGEFLAGRATAPGAPAEILIGLGPGLTPSGDDLIGGAMIALHTLGHGETARRLAAWALPLAQTRTGAISAAHLSCAAAGEGSAALHELVAALLASDDAGIVGATRALAAIGHSSGWDMLAGAALACASVVRDGLSAGGG
jgi:hypothetical protein